MLIISDVEYVIVANTKSDDKQERVGQLLKDGYFIFNKAQTREAIHYLMVRGEKIAGQHPRTFGSVDKKDESDE